MRTLLAATAFLALATTTYAESLIATTPGTFPAIVFPDAVMRTFSGVNPDALVVSQSGAIGSSLTSGSLHPGSVIDIAFEGAVSNLSVVFEPFVTSSVTCEVEAIDVNGALRSLGSHFSASPTTVPLGGTVIGAPIERLRIRPNTGVMRLLRVDYTPRVLTPGKRIVASAVVAGSAREVYLRGCEGRTLEITPESVSPSAEFEIAVGPAKDSIGDQTKTVAAKPGKTRKFKIERPELYRIRILNVSAGISGDVTLLTAESFSKNYAKRKFALDPKGGFSAAEFAFGVLPDTTIDLSTKLVGEFFSPVSFTLFETPAPIEAVDLDLFSAPTSAGTDFLAIPVHLGGALRLRASPFSNLNDRVEVTLVRSKPLPGVGDLILQ